MERRVCLYCSKGISVGRSDKKFCDHLCKDAYNNALRGSENRDISKIDVILKRNRRALKKLFDSKRKSRVFGREQLIREGFEFGFQTHVAVTKAQLGEITFCYDYGYRQIGAATYEVRQCTPRMKIKNGGLLAV
jgi:hypothetical protein